MSTSHPSDEVLSAHLDGHAPEVVEHVTTCSTCLARLDGLRRAATLVATPPPRPDAATRDDAIARALDDATTSRPRRLVLVAAAAAVVVGAGIATPLLLRNNGPRHTTAALSTSKTAGSQPIAGTSDAAEADRAAVLPVDGGYLGDQSDPRALGGLVSSALVPAAPGAGTSAGAAAGAPAPNAARRGDAGCAAPTDGGMIVYRARLRWKGAAAQVFGIDPGHRLVVIDSARCRVLVDQHF